MTGSGQVRSPEAVCWPHLRKVCNHARARVSHRSIFSLQVFIRVPPCTICISVTWGQVRFMIFTLQAYGKILKCAKLRVNESKPPNSFRIMTDYLICDDPGVTYWQGHRERSSEVMEVIRSWLPINHDTMVLKTCKWYQTVRLVKTRRLLCSMAITTNIRSWPDIDLRSSFKLTYESHHVHISNCLDEINTMVPIWCLYLS